MQMRTVKKAGTLALGSSLMLLSVMPAASAFAAARAPISNVQAHVMPGNRLTASSNHMGVKVDYQFLAKYSGSWHIIRKYEHSWHTNWTPPAGVSSVQIQVNALTESQVANHQWAKHVASSAVVDSTVTISGTPMLTVSGDTYTASAKSSDGSTVYYQFIVTAPDGHSYIAQPYTTSNTFTFNAPDAGYKIHANCLTEADFQAKDWAGHVASNTLSTVGAPYAVTLSPSTSTLAADGAASETVTATVVDKAGHPVTSYNGTVGVVVNPNQFSGSALSILPTNANNENTANDTQSNPYWFTAKDGVATINVAELLASNNVTGGYNLTPGGLQQLSTVVGDTASVVPLLPNAGLETNNAAKITLTAPQATYNVMSQVLQLGILSPLPSILANNEAIQITPATGDQNQVPMNGSTGIGDGGTATVTVSGPATLTYYNASGQSETNLTHITMPMDSENASFVDALFLVPNPGQTGTVTVSISNGTDGLKDAAPMQIKVVAPGNPASWSGPSGFTFTADQVANDAYARNNLSESFNTWTHHTYSFAVQAVDANGLAVPAPKPAISVTTASGQGVAGLSATIKGDPHTGTYAVTMHYNGGNVAAGTYDVTISEGLTQTLVVPVTITTGQPNQLAVTPSANTSTDGARVVDVTPQNPSLTIEGQIEDVLGNPVAAPNGTSITFTDIPKIKPIGNMLVGDPLKLSGGTGSATSQTVYVGQNGMASITATALAKGDDGQVSVTANLPNGWSLNPNQQDSATVVETGSLVYQLVGTTMGTPHTAGTSGDPQVLVSEENAAHSLMNSGDTLEYSVTSTSPFFGGQQGTLNYGGPNTPLTINTQIAGTYTVKIWDASNSAVAPITETVQVNANSAAGIGLFANGAEVSQDVPGALDMTDSVNTGVPNEAAGTVQTTANTPVPVWVHVTDGTGNIVNAPSGGVTVDLSAKQKGAAFETQSGQVISQVTIPAGSNGVEVYLVNGKSQKVDVSATYEQAPTLSFAGTSNGVATEHHHSSGYSWDWNINVMDQFGNPIAGLTSADASVVDTSVSPTLTFNAADGNLTLTPVTGSPGEYVLSVSRPYNLRATDVAQITIGGASINGTF